MCLYGIFKFDFRVHSFQGMKILNLKKIQAIVNMPMPINPQQIQVFNGMA
jgi:hypothetical protein